MERAQIGSGGVFRRAGRAPDCSGGPFPFEEEARRVRSEQAAAVAAPAEGALGVEPKRRAERLVGANLRGHILVDATNEEIILVEADVMFPSQSSITIDPGRSVSIVGRSENDGERVTFDGAAGSRFFVVDGGALYLTHLSLVNGSAPESNGACDDTSRD